MNNETRFDIITRIIHELEKLSYLGTGNMQNAEYLNEAKMALTFLLSSMEK